MSYIHTNNHFQYLSPFYCPGTKLQHWNLSILIGSGFNFRIKKLEGWFNSLRRGWLHRQEQRTRKKADGFKVSLFVR